MGLQTGSLLQQGHVGILFLLVRDGGVGPFIVGAVGQVSNHGGVNAFLAHSHSQVVHNELAVTGVGEGFDVVVHVGQVSALVSDDNDAGILCLLQDGIQRAQVNGNDADGVDLLGDQVFHELRLLGGVDLVGALLVDVQFGMGLGIFVNADLHTDEPGVGRVLGNDNDLVGAVVLLLCGGAAGYQAKDHHKSQQQRDELFHD